MIWFGKNSLNKVLDIEFRWVGWSGLNLPLGGPEEEVLAWHFVLFRIPLILGNYRMEVMVDKEYLTEIQSALLEELIGKANNRQILLMKIWLQSELDRRECLGQNG